MKSFRFITFLAAGAMFAPMALGAAAPSAWTTVTHNRPRGIAGARYLRPHNPNATMSVTVALKLRNTAALGRFLRNLQNPASPEYHQYLSPAAFTSRFSPTEAQAQAVAQYLGGAGVRVTGISSNRLLIHTRASAAALERAFRVEIVDYSLKGRSFYASLTDPKLPSAIAGTVSAVIGLSNYNVMQPMFRLSPNRGKPGAGTVPAGYSPQQITTAYDWPAVTNTANGTGESIAIATAYTFKNSDVTGFWSYYGLPNHAVSIISVDGTSHRTNIETTIDIERSGAMAPGATILVYEGANAQLATFTDVYNRIVTDDKASVMTTSWGTAESNMSTATLNTDDSIFKQASAEGISLFAAAGDNGSSDGTSNNDEADYPSSDPYLVACGGTTLNLTGANAISSETAWSGAGGAESHYFAEPAWQIGANVPQNGYRNTSDLALDANPNTGYSVLSGGRWSVYGGTSFVAPQMAALFAVRNGRTGTRLGQATSAIYNDANGSTYAQDFHDITSGSNGAFPAGPYWDHPTGWGSIDASNLILHIQ